MTMQPFPDTFLPTVSEEVETEILREIAEEWAKEVYDEIQEAYPKYIISPAVQLPPRERFEKYMQRLVEAYPTDPVGRLTELNWLLNTEYTEMLKTGLAPAPISMPWRVLQHVPRIMKDIQRDLRSCYLSWARTAAPAGGQTRGEYSPGA